MSVSHDIFFLKKTAACGTTKEQKVSKVSKERRTKASCLLSVRAYARTEACRAYGSKAK
jgi:hypothetical protein